MTTNQQNIAVLAEFMGWHNEGISSTCHPSCTIHKNGRCNDWNPYEDWNHTHQVLDKVMEDDELSNKFFDTLGKMMAPAYMGMPVTMLKCYIDADQATLMNTLVSILPKSND